MKFALFLGCKIPYYVPHYETSMRAVLKELGVGLVDVEFNCCGYPAHHLDVMAFVLASARNMALAESRDLPIMTPCKCCYGSLKKAQHLIRTQDRIRDEINETLREEGLRVDATCEVKHLLSVLYHDVGLEQIQKRISKPYEGLQVAVHYGCHALRPSKIVEFDDPVAPTKFDRLVAVTGAKSVEWPLKLQCCGNPLWGKNDALSKDLAVRKVMDAKRAGADFLCVACTYCQIQFDMIQSEIVAERSMNDSLASLLYPQLLGLSMGLDARELGLERNELDARKLSGFLATPAQEQEEKEEEEESSVSVQGAQA